MANPKITYEELAAIGDITVGWNGIEEALERLIWEIARWRHPVGKLVTADLGNVSRIQLALNLANHYLDPILISEVKVIAGLFDYCRISRNDIIHGLPKPPLPAGTPRQLVKASAKAGTGKIVSKATELDHEALMMVCQDQSYMLLALTTLQLKISDFHRHCDKMLEGSSSQPFDHAAYYNKAEGSLYGIAALQIRVQEQRLRLQKQSAN